MKAQSDFQLPLHYVTLLQHTRFDGYAYVIFSETLVYNKQQIYISLPGFRVAYIVYIPHDLLLTVPAFVNTKNRTDHK